MGHSGSASKTCYTTSVRGGVWHKAPEHHLVFTFQTVPTTGHIRKKMRYLKDQDQPGDTYYNVWPVPMYQPAQMPRLTQAEHDTIFAGDDVVIDDAEVDGAGTAIISDLGDKVLPFPREFHVKLWQEMIHVWEVEVGVLFQPGSGQSLLAFVLERKRAVGIVKNKAHKDFVMKNLVAAVRSFGLAPDKRPPKPVDLIAWETTRPSTLSAPALPKGPPVPKAEMPAVPVLPMPVVTGPASPAAGAGPTLPPPAVSGLAAFGSSALR